MIADIEPPDLETKVAILKRKADLDGIFLPDDIAIYMANKIKSNVRELEGSLVRLVAISSLRGVPISKMLAQDAMKNVIDSEHPEGLTMERISRAVASHYKMSVEELKSKKQLPIDSGAAAGGDVSMQTPYKTQLSRGRPRVWRQASYDRNALVR